jgi:hypothetical protein
VFGIRLPKNTTVGNFTAGLTLRHTDQFPKATRLTTSATTKQSSVESVRVELVSTEPVSTQNIYEQSLSLRIKEQDSQDSEAERIVRAGVTN